MLKEIIVNKEMISNINKVASQTRKFDPVITDGLQRIIKRLSSILSDNELDDVVEKIEKVTKEAKLIENGNIVVCVDNFNNYLFKGRRYLVSNSDIPGFLGVSELDGTDVGIFSVNRFVLDNNEQ